MSRRGSRSRSDSRRRGSPSSRKSSRRKERDSRRSRDRSFERSSHWKERVSRRGILASSEKSASSRKAREEQRFLEVGDDSHVFSTLDLMFVVGKHLLKLRDNEELPLNVYELRRRMSDYFEGPHRLRFSTVCSINVLSNLLKYMHLGTVTEQEQPAAKVPPESQGETPRSHDHGSRTESAHTAEDSALSNADGVSVAESHATNDVAGVEGVPDANGDADKEDTVDNKVEPDNDGNTGNGEGVAGEDKAAEQPSPLEVYLDGLPEVSDQSFRDVKFHHSLVQLELQHGVLRVMDVRGQLLKRILLRNRKKQRVVDVADALATESIITTGRDHPSREDLDTSRSATVDDYDLTNLTGRVYPIKGGSKKAADDADEMNVDDNIAVSWQTSTDTETRGLQSGKGRGGSDKDGEDTSKELGRDVRRTEGMRESGRGTSLSARSDDPPYDLDGLYKVLYQTPARELKRIAHFQLKEQSGFREICTYGTRADCRMQNYMSLMCNKIHFKRIILPNTLVQLGDCSYLDTCRHIETCRFVHYQVESDIPPRAPVDEVSQGQWICCDVRKLDFSIFNPFVSVVMADPPWDIHMDLPYGTMKDSEMRHLKVQNIQSEGLLFLWVTGRTLEVGRECMEIWGYRQMDEIVWVKTNQLQRIIRTGRTGHWINHSKEHCLIGIKGNPVINRYLDCDVVVSEVRETSRKPDEIYGIIERMVPGALKLEIFGRSHNVRNNWITLGNQLDGYKLTHPEIKKRYEEILAKGDATAAAPANAPQPAADAANTSNPETVM
ncbi:MT-A70 family protein, putative [Babesia bigemina]|uniref:MT-A70 family protein, putative n=1 Tax=Babesia bigemina TaxID=5866 RepID=A0A061D7B6_BABBI|nr:MT-A70 family protein, putative [Babesia bigemina]CDR96433.1 MT-A70 family protein, putative [Babesia bigemina]|eukprot:XP_012768619.1 MT-A70 family protein, putative [Babesia bigemina]